MADTDKSLPTLAGELWEMVVAYAKQETIEPLRNLGRFVGLGLAAVFLLGTGLVLLALAGLRALQTETDGTFDGDWTWAPYLIVVAGTIFVTVLALRAVGRHKRKAAKR